ncbi:phage tail tape measure protein [Lysinibacillus sp. NPDC096418]|uniref:phage tail tape measure protein n=1 Tax=Lysinibacillus sp. NPDC096418 TaxID=3364138 RepID=UPI00380C9D9D
MILIFAKKGGEEYMTNISAIELSLNADNFNGSIDQSIRRLTAMGAELQALQARGNEYENSIEGLSQKNNILFRSVEASNIKLREQSNRYTELVASGTASEEAIEQQAIAVNEALAEYNQLNTQLSEVSNQLDIQSSKWNQFQEVGGKMKSVGESISTISTPIKAIGVLAFNAAVDFENAFAGVRQSVNTSEENFKKLEDGIRSMAKELPVSATEIAGVVESAGQLGIAEDHLLSFSRTVIDLGASTSMTREEAATEFARFAGIVGMSQGDFDRLGSSVVELSNKMGVTESDIIAMGMGFAKQGAQLGMTEAQIMGLAGTMSSLGIEADTGGAAMTTVLQKIQKAVGDGGESLSGFAKAANMSSADFKKAFETDAVSALDALVKGLAETSEGGANLKSILTDLGVNGDETDVLMSMANASDLLSSAVDSSSQAWKDNTALSNEAAQNYKSTESQMTMMKNQLVDIGISIGQILIPMVLEVMDVIAPWIEKFSNLSSETQKTIAIIGGLAAAIGPLLVVGGTLITSVGSIISAVGGFSTAIGAAGGATTSFGAAWALITGPIGATVGIIAGIGLAAYAVGRELNESSIQVADWKDKVSESTAESVGSFLELSDQATVALNQMAWSGVAVTEEMAANMVGIYNEMGDQVLTEMQSDHAQELETMQNHFAQSDALTEEQEAKILERVAQSQAEQQQVIADGKARIEEIYQNASENNRGITEAEQQEINLIQQTMTENAIKHLSDSEVEQKIILENLKNEASNITAEQAAEVVRNSLKQKEDVLKEAEEQYNETHKWAVRQRDETGTMSAEEAQAVIDEAARKRDETVANAEDMHQKVVSEAQLQAEEHVNKVDWETGEIKSRWKVYTENVASDAKALGKAISDGWNNAWTATKNRVNEIKQTAEKKITDMKTAVETKMGEVKTKIETKWNEAQVFLSGISLGKIGKDIISGLIGGIGDMFDSVKKKVGELAGLIPEWVREKLKINSPSRVMIPIGKGVGEGLAIGIEQGNEGVRKAAEELAEAAIPNVTQHLSITKEAMQKVQEIVSSATKANSAEIEVLQKEAENKRIEISQKASEKIATIKNNATKQQIALTVDQIAQIKQIEEQSLKDSETITKQYADKIAKIESNSADAKFIALKEYVEAQKAAGEMTAKQEAEFWRYSATTFKEGTKEKSNALKAYNKAYSEMVKDQFDNEKEYVDKRKKYNTLSLAEELKIYENFLAQYEAGTEERTYYEEKFYDTKKAISEKIKTINNDYLKQTQDINKKLLDEEQKLNDAYTNALESRAKSIKGYFGLFDEVKIADSVESSSLTQNLSEQVNALSQWRIELSQLEMRGLSSTIIDELEAMGPNVLAQLQALNRMTDGELLQYEELYEEKLYIAREAAIKELEPLQAETKAKIEALRNTAKTELTTLNTEWQGKINEVVFGTSEILGSMNDIGKNAIQGLIDGMKGMQPTLQQTANSLAKNAAETIKKALNINPTSSVIQNVSEGLVNGLNSIMNKATNVSERLANSAVLDSPSSPAQKSKNNIVAQNSSPSTIIVQSVLDGQILGESVVDVVSGRQYNNASINALTRGLSGI